MQLVYLHIPYRLHKIAFLEYIEFIYSEIHLIRWLSDTKKDRSLSIFLENERSFTLLLFSWMINVLLSLWCVSEAAVQYDWDIHTVWNCFFVCFSVTLVKPEKPLKVPKLKDFYISVRCSATIVSTWHDTSWLMSGFVPVRGNISYQNGNRSTPLILRIRRRKQMQSVAKLTSISRSWPLKSMGTSQHKVFSTYIMQGNFTLPLPATVSTVETVKAAQLLHNSSALSTNLPYTRRELSCRISPSRPGFTTVSSILPSLLR